MSGRADPIGGELARARTAIRVLTAQETASKRLAALPPVLAGGDALAAEAEGLALALLRHARTAPEFAARVGDVPARQAEVNSAVKLAHAGAAVSQALDRRQGRGTTQRVVVERLAVHGGQNVIGALAAAQGRGAPLPPADGEGGEN
jgi:hypothetical protein